MKTLRNELLATKTREEYMKRREEFKKVPMDREIIHHISSLFPKSCDAEEFRNGIIVERF